ncbi:pentatricopeptide repeat-containing protein At4g20090-like isoform X2 [Cornus florida]|uniref:pentatricopeptide repeat-containing protein At4g20090-like isoform X2 n=1 Tax=Cornus florida TaxID=4283 RepID=UPI00289EBFCB|nr:pentatricopeptide repeat-containing protein At4g20090-like isoform X2 [Cornus florida]
MPSKTQNPPLKSLQISGLPPEYHHQKSLKLQMLISCRTFSICIRFLGRQGRVKEALCLFKEMESKFDCKPDNLVYNNLLYVLCKKESSGQFIDAAILIFRMIGSPDTYSYSNILVGLCKFGRFETALEVFRDMGCASLAPTRTAINVLIGDLCLLSAKEGAIGKIRVKDARRPYTILVPNVCSNTGAILPATEVFWATYDLGLLPSTFVIKQLLSELCRLGKMEEALKLLKVIEERKLRFVEESYTIVIQCLCERHQVEEVSHLFGRILSQGFNPKLVVYNAIICMLCKMGSMDRAERVFKIMNKKRCLPDNVTYTALIHAFGVARNWEAAYSLLVEMLGLGWFPHFHTYNLVDNLLREHGRVDLSIKLEGKIEAQMLHKHCKLGQLEAAYEKLRSMLEKGICPPIYIREAFEHAFGKTGKLKIARELLNKIDEIIYKTEETGLKGSDQLCP